MWQKKIKRKISLLLALVLAGSWCVTASAHTAAIEVGGDNRYKSVRLTPEIYNHAQSDLSDLLIRDSSGNTVPYFIHSVLKTTDLSKSGQTMELINSYTKDGSFYFDYKINPQPNTDYAATSIEFETRGTNFAKAVELYGSYDDIHWELVQRDKIYSVDGVSKLYIEFDQTQKYTHYRIKLDNNHERIAFDEVWLYRTVKTAEEIYFVETITPSFTVSFAVEVVEKERVTHVAIEGIKHLRLSDITLHTDSMFKRTARTPDGTYKEIFNLVFDGNSYSDTVIPLNRSIPREDIYTLTIFDGDDYTINVDGVTVRYFADEIVFESTPGETYTLEFGANDPVQAPVYDIERYKADVLRGDIDRADIGAVTYEFTPEPDTRDYGIIFNIVVAVVALLLGVVILVRLKK